MANGIIHRGIDHLCRRNFFDWMPDPLYLRLRYWAKMGRPLHLNSPSTFNEKLQWLKIYDRNPEYTTLVDKYSVKPVVAQKIGGEYIIPTLGVWDSFDDIDFGALPDQFVLKCTHDSGGLAICRDKSTFNKELARKKIEKSLKTDYYIEAREWPYKNVVRRVFAEEYMEDASTKELRDYKFFCFNGIVRCFKIDFDRFVEHRANYYDRNGNIVDIGEVVCPPDSSRDIKLPENLSKMVELAEILAKDFSFVRVDFYEVNKKIYFGEITFYPAAGMGKFIYPENDEMLGSWLKLPQEE